MKKLYPLRLLLSVIGVCTLPMTSCSSNDEDNGTNVPPIENAFCYNQKENPIASVVYTVDKESRIYSIYFSPTRGLIDIEGMLLADDYILIKTPTPSGDIDLTAQNGWNSLSYKKFEISAGTAANVSKSLLSLQLTSQTTVKMTLDAALTSGETLQANYYGTCIRHTDQSQLGEAITLDKSLFSWWRKATTVNTNNYYIGVSNVKTIVQNGTSIKMTEPGYALIIDLYSNSGSQWKTFPTGTFIESDNHEDHTYYDSNSFAVYFDGQNYTTMHLSSDITISRDENNIARIATTFVDTEGLDHPISFEGDLRVGNGSKMPSTSQLMRDIEIKGFYASGSYEGDILKNGSGLSEINIIDEAGDNKQPNSYGINIAVFNTKFLNPKTERKLIEGIYKVSSSGEQGTWMPTSEIPLLGIQIPMGTYAAFVAEDDGTNNTDFYAYTSDGTIEIKELGNNRYTINVDLESQTGYSIKGGIEDYNITLTDNSKDDDNDGSSTLTEDLNLDLNYVKQARCYPQEKIYIVGLGEVNVSEVTTIAQPSAPQECGYQFIDIGQSTGTYEHDPTGEYNDPGKLVEGDIFRLDLIVSPGDEGKITPGTYTVSPNRYLVSMWPGVCFRGFQAAEGHIGSRWLYISSAIGNGYPTYYHDPTYSVINGWLNVPSAYEYASLYEGTVTISKADGGDNWFTFEIDGEDVLHHKIKGSWTGPVVLGNSNTPVGDSGKHFEANTSSRTKKSEESADIVKSEKKHFPLMRDYVSKASESTVRPVPRVTFR